MWETSCLRTVIKVPVWTDWALHKLQAFFFPLLTSTGLSTHQTHLLSHVEPQILKMESWITHYFWLPSFFGSLVKKNKKQNSFANKFSRILLILKTFKAEWAAPVSPISMCQDKIDAVKPIIHPHWIDVFDYSGWLDFRTVRMCTDQDWLTLFCSFAASRIIMWLLFNSYLVCK